MMKLSPWMSSRAWIFVLIAIMSTVVSIRAQDDQSDSGTTLGRGYAKPQLQVQLGHSDSVLSVAFSRDSRYVLTGSQDKTAALWDADTGRLLRRFQGHSGVVSSVGFSPDSKFVLTGSSDATAGLWEAATGKLLRRFGGHSNSVRSVAFSPDGTFLLTGSWDKTAQLHDAQTGKLLRRFEGVSLVALSPDGRFVLSDSSDATASLWEARTGKLLRRFEGHSKNVSSVSFSPDGRFVLTGSSDTTAALWEAGTGKLLRRFEPHDRSVESVAFSPKGTLVLTGNWLSVSLWDAETGKLIRQRLGGASNQAVFSPDGRYMLTGSSDKNAALLWEANSGELLRKFEGYSRELSSVTFSPDKKFILTGSRESTAELWATDTGELQRRFKWQPNWGMEVGMRFPVGVAFSPDGRHVVTGSSDKPAGFWEVDTGTLLHRFEYDLPAGSSLAFSADGKSVLTVMLTGGNQVAAMWEAATGKLLRRFEGHAKNVASVAFSPDSRFVLTGSDNTAQLWDANTGKLLRRFDGHFDRVSSVSFSPDGRYVLTGSLDKTARLWEAGTGELLHSIQGHSDGVSSVAFSPDGTLVLTGSWDKTAALWKADTGKLLQRLEGHSSEIESVAFSHDGMFVATGSRDQTTRIWAGSTGEQLCILISFGDGKWAVVDRDGRFDASNRGNVEGLHWVVNNEPIVLAQLKERYYEPGLLAKILGFNKQPLRDVSKFESPKLHPHVKYAPLAKGSNTLTVTLTNRGGGIGRIQIFVNGKEFIDDARDDALKKNPDVSQATLNIDISKANNTESGRENDIRVVAWNVENYISSSRGARIVWRPEGPAKTERPEVYAIIGGISHYAGSHLNLNFAAKDAVDMANAIELGAKRLFGADKVHLTLLSTAEDLRSIPATKENFIKAFAEVRQRAKPTDILVVYLAGHGISLQQGSDTYCYLTQEARTTDTAVLADSAIRQQTTITSEELVEWIKQIPANKQVVMLDTCAAGAAQAQLKLVDKREASGDAIRAIDRARDRTGSYILMGSAADAVSYEASRYGQGLLTYALLKGMKGGALRNDEFVDVSKLFQYARDEVEQLAKDIGGVQKPMVFAPTDDSFEVGQLKTEDKLKIALATPRPMILRPRFLDEEADDDTLDLMKALRARLRDESFVTGRGATQATLVFVDDEEFPGGIRPTGRYTVQANNVTVTLRLRRDGKEIATSQITGTTNDVPRLAAKVVEAVKEAIGKLPSR